MAIKTVFVTGASGFIAKHIVVKLLNAGYRVVGSVRSMERGAEVRAAVLPHLDDAEGLDGRLSFAVLDLMSDEGWDHSLAGTDALLHTASPFPLTQPKNENDVIHPAVDGAVRALRAAKAAAVGRVVLTSSCVAVMYTELRQGRDSFDEDDWTDLRHPAANAYAKSKTLAERAAWDFVRGEASEIALTTINPGVVLGAPTDGKYGTSVRVVERILRGEDPMVPQVGFPIVDVRDVAEMHLRALTHDDTAGKRFIAADRFLWLQEIAEILKAAHPDRKIVTRRAPNLLMRMMGWFDKEIASIVPLLGVREDVSNSRARSVMGMQFIDAAHSVQEIGAFLIKRKIV